MRNLQETFHYDNQNRLTEVRLGSVQTGTSAYDGYGRMTAKTADGQAVFSNAVYSTTAKPHAMDAAETLSGVFPSQPQNISYTCFDKVSQIMQGSKTLNYTYGYDHQRIFMEEHVGNTVRTKHYVGMCEYVTEASGTKSWTFLAGPYGVFAVVEKQNNAETLHYILKDNLGSWTTITNSSGTVEQQLSYDAWGNLRNPNTWTGDFTGTPMFDRGYTGHEHLYNFGLINMNGRMYDPVMSSFLSVDQYVSSPESAQGFNRYAYCMNNPLRYIDPSGWTMVNPVTGYTPNSATNANDPYAYCRRPLEPRDLGILQLPQSELNGTWMEGNERHGGGEQLSEPTPVADEEDPPKGVTVHSAEELPSKAFWHYQFGGKKDYWIDASTIDLNYISFNNLQKNKDGTYWVNLFEYSMTDDVAITLGKIHLIPIGENQYKIDVDKFDFNIEWDKGWTLRNIGTFVYGYIHGPVIDNIPIPTFWLYGKPYYIQPSAHWGGPFDFHFSKTVYIKP